MDGVSLLGRLCARRRIRPRRCRAFQSEEKVKKGVGTSRKLGTLKDDGFKSKEGTVNGVLNLVKSTVWGAFNSRLRSEDEYRAAVAKLEEVFASVRFI